MNFRKLLPIVIVVVVVHLLILWCISSSNDTDEPQNNTPEKEAVDNPGTDAGTGTAADGNTGAELAPVVDDKIEQPKTPGTKTDAGKRGNDTSKQPAVQTPAAKGNAVSSGSRYFKSTPKAMPASMSNVTKAPTAILVLDQDTKGILWSKNADKPVPIASLTKMMTALILSEAVKARKVTYDTTVTVTREDRAAISKFGSGCYIDVGEVYTLEDFLKAMMIKSANDCAYLTARFLGGTHEEFVKMMNERAKQLKLDSFVFKNANGYPTVANGQRQINMGSATDVAYLADRVSSIPEIMKWAGTKRDCLRENAKNRFDLVTTSHLLRDGFPGVTGLKTGFINESGYCIACTCERNGRHILVVVMGCADQNTRDNCTKKLLDWAYAE